MHTYKLNFSQEINKLQKRSKKKKNSMKYQKIKVCTGKVELFQIWSLWTQPLCSWSTFDLLWSCQIKISIIYIRNIIRFFNLFMLFKTSQFELLKVKKSKIWFMKILKQNSPYVGTSILKKKTIRYRRSVLALKNWVRILKFRFQKNAHTIFLSNKEIKKRGGDVSKQVF